MSYLCNHHSYAARWSRQISSPFIHLEFMINGFSFGLCTFWQIVFDYGASGWRSALQLHSTQVRSVMNKKWCPMRRYGRLWIYKVREIINYDEKWEGGKEWLMFGYFSLSCIHFYSILMNGNISFGIFYHRFGHWPCFVVWKWNIFC